MWITVTRWFRRRSDDDFAAEIEGHVAIEVDRLVASGMSEEEARFAARRAFGNTTAARERFHESRPGSSLEWIGQDVRYALRGMRRNPVFTTIAIASLAIGIGANTTIFGVLDTMLLRTPAHVRDAGRIHRVYFAMPDPAGGLEPRPRIDYKTYAALRDRVHGFDGVGAFWRTSVSSGHGLDARSIDAAAVTPSFFGVLGLRPALGRFFAADEEPDQSDHVAVLSYEAWHAWYGGDSSVVGRRIDVSGLPYVIVGVAPAGFTGIDLDRVDLWLPLGVAARLLSPRALDPHGGSFFLEIVAKRRANTTIAQIERAGTNVFRDITRGAPRYEETLAKSRVILGPIVAARGPARDASASVSVWVAAVSLLVLLIACANVANLLLLRGLTRARETALRRSLGASRSRLVRQALVEGMLLSALGALFAVILGRWTGAALRAFLIPHAADGSGVDARLIAFTALVAIATGLLASILPALAASRGTFGPLVNTGRASAGPGRFRLQRILIGSQVALATLLVVGAGLFVTSLRNVRALDMGFDVDHILYVQLEPALGRKRLDSASAASALATYESMVRRVRQLPGVANASLTAGEPFSMSSAVAIRRRGAPPLVTGSPVPFMRAVGADYFETMGTKLLRGRFFTAADHSPSAHVAIIDEATARKYWPHDDPLDPCVYLGGEDGPCTQIVGVVANSVMWQVTGDKGDIVYVPLESGHDLGVSMMEVRTDGDPTTLVPAVRHAILGVSPNLPWVDIEPVSRMALGYDAQLKSWRLGASMFTAFGLLALGLAAVGLYGLLSYVVAQRTQEIGVRKALGAPGAGLIRLVLGDALSMTLGGVVIGIIIAIAAGQLVAHLLYGVSPRDPFVIALGAGVLILVAIAACLAPARRAARVDPVIALRAE